MPSPRPRVFARVLARIGYLPRCEACGFPEPEPQVSLVIYDGEETGSCEACACLLDPFGRPVGDGRRWSGVVTRSA